MQDPKSASFLFNLVEFPIKDGRTYERRGVATGELYRTFEKLKSRSKDNGGLDGNSGDLCVSSLCVWNNFVNDYLSRRSHPFSF